MVLLALPAAACGSASDPAERAALAFCAAYFDAASPGDARAWAASAAGERLQGELSRLTGSPPATHHTTSTLIQRQRLDGTTVKFRVRVRSAPVAGDPRGTPPLETVFVLLVRPVPLFDGALLEEQRVVDFGREG